MDEEINRQSKDDIVPSSVEFRALKEIVETIKHKKDHLIANINSKVMKLYPEKEKRFVNELVSAVVGKMFDRNDDNNEKNHDDAQKRLPNITQFVSSLVKRIFKDKNDETESDDNVEPFPDSTKCDSLLKENEDAFKQSLYESISAWAREKMALLSNERLKLLNGIPRKDSCDSENSEIDLECGSSYLMARINDCKQDTDITTSNKNHHNDMKVLSCDTDSDSSSSTDIANSADSGISDNEAPISSKQSTLPSTSAKVTTAKRTTLQRYYHVFSAKELPDLIEGSVHGVNVLKDYYDHGNWAVIAEKH